MTDTNPPADRTAEKCACYWTDPSTWTTHYGAAEPGSQREWNPECPEHGHATEIRARIKAATPGPWTTGSRDDSGNLYIGQAEPGGALVATAGDGDAELIAHAPFDLAYLLARVEELAGQLGKSEEEWAIRVFTRADHGHWFHQHADADTFDEDLAVTLEVAANSIDLSTGVAPVNHGVAVVKRTVWATKWETVKTVGGTDGS
jgi:hypothetical protein